MTLFLVVNDGGTSVFDPILVNRWGNFCSKSGGAGSVLLQLWPFHGQPSCFSSSFSCTIFSGMVYRLLSERCVATSFYQRSANHVSFYSLFHFATYCTLPIFHGAKSEEEKLQEIGKRAVIRATIIPRRGSAPGTRSHGCRSGRLFSFFRFPPTWRCAPPPGNRPAPAGRRG